MNEKGLSKEELFAIIVANFVNSTYDHKNTLRVITCTPLDKSVMVNDIEPLVKALNVEVTEREVIKPTGEVFNCRSFEWEGVNFFAYYED